MTNHEKAEGTDAANSLGKSLSPDELAGSNESANTAEAEAGDTSEPGDAIAEPNRLAPATSLELYSFSLYRAVRERRITPEQYAQGVIDNIRRRRN